MRGAVQHDDSEIAEEALHILHKVHAIDAEVIKVLPKLLKAGANYALVEIILDVAEGMENLSEAFFTALIETLALVSGVHTDIIIALLFKHGKKSLTIVEQMRASLNKEIYCVRRDLAIVLGLLNVAASDVLDILIDFLDADSLSDGGEQVKRVITALRVLAKLNSNVVLRLQGIIAEDITSDHFNLARAFFAIAILQHVEAPYEVTTELLDKLLALAIVPRCTDSLAKMVTHAERGNHHLISLQDDSVLKREYWLGAIIILSMIGVAKDEIIQFLFEIFKRENEFKELLGLLFMAAVGMGGAPPNPLIFEVLVDCLCHKMPTVSAFEIQLMDVFVELCGEEECKCCIPVLTTALTSDNECIQAKSACILGCSGNLDMPELDRASKLIKAFNGIHFIYPKHIATLVAMAKENEAIKQYLLSLLDSAEASEKERLGALIVLSELDFPEEKVAQCLINLFVHAKSPDILLCETLFSEVKGVWPLNQSIANALTQCLGIRLSYDIEYKDFEYLIMDLLMDECRKKNQCVITGLTVVLASDNEYIRNKAAIILYCTNINRDEKIVHILDLALNYDCKYMRIMAELLLAAIGNVNAKVTAILSDICHDNNLPTKKMLARHIEVIVKKHPEVAGIFLPLLKDPKSEIRTIAQQKFAAVPLKLFGENAPALPRNVIDKIFDGFDYATFSVQERAQFSQLPRVNHSWCALFSSFNATGQRVAILEKWRDVAVAEVAVSETVGHRVVVGCSQ